MDAASTALNSLFSKVPAPGTRDGTAISDIETGQKIEQNADQAGSKLSQAADQAGEKIGQTVDQAEKKLDQTTSSSSSGVAGGAGSTSGTTGSTSSTGVSGTTSTTGETSITGAHVDKVTEETDTVADQEVAPAVEHDHIHREHETRERDVVEKEVHKDHYHTTIQPLKDTEVQDTEHKFEQKDTEYRNIDKDDGAAKARVDQKLAGFEDTVDKDATKETAVKEDTVVGEHVHHHLHEIIQPVIEKDVYQKEVTHVTNPIKETVQEKSEEHGVTKAKAISVDDFKHKLEGEKAHEVDATKPVV